MGALLEFLEVRLEYRRGELRGGHVDRPAAGARTEAAGVDVVGWLLGEETQAVAVELLADGCLLRRLPLGVERPDLAGAFRDRPEAALAGFRATVSLLGTEPEVALELRAVLADQRRIPFATLAARRRWREGQAPERELVSVVIPCYNQARFLGEAIESVLAQTYPHLELLVVDDGSVDNTAAVARRYPGVRYLRQENQGLAAARNAGIRNTNGDYLVFLDADDRLLPHALQTGLAHLEAHPEAAFVSGHYRYIDEAGQPLPTHDQRAEGDPFVALLRTNVAGMPGTVVYRRAVFELVHGFDARYRRCEDYELYLRIARQFAVVCHNELVGLYRQHRRSMSRDPGPMLQNALAVMRAQKRFLRTPELVEAYEAGVAFWRQYFGGPLRDDVRSAAQQGDWRRALRGVAILAVSGGRSRLPSSRRRRLRSAGREA